jgi:YVTN family beta-propeller protein
VTDFRILGPFEVVVQRQAVSLGGRKQMALLAILLLHRGEPLSRDRLIDQLWGERPPATADKTLQVYVSNLRKVLGAEMIATVGRGYRLAVAPEQVDADRFETFCERGRRALADGDAATARGLLESALSLWRGEPLADFAYEQFAQAEIGRLQEAWMQALEDRIDAELALGEHETVVAELEVLVARHPARERLLRQLILALYRSDRQVDALEAYRRGRKALSDELGLDPSPRLRELEQAVLRHDPALQAPSVGSPFARRVTRPILRGGLLIALGGVILLAAAVTAVAVVLSRGSGAVVPVPNSVVAIDARTNQIVGQVPAGASPAGIAFGSGSLWVANIDDQTVSRIDPVALRAQRTFTIDDTPTGIAASATGVWVVSSQANATSVTVRRIDPQFDVITQTTRIGNVVAGGPGGVSVNGSAIWVAPSTGQLARLDPVTGRVVQQVDPNSSPSEIAVGEGAVWVAGGDAGNVTRIDPTGLQTPIAVGNEASAIAVGDGAVWVVDSLDDDLVRIDPQTNAVTTTIPVGTSPNDVAVGAGSVWVANGGDDTVTRIDPASDRVLATIGVGGSPQSFAFADRRAWVTIDAPNVKPAAVARQGGVLRIDGPDVDYMDPALAYLDNSWQLLHATCATLLNYPDRPGAAGSQLTAEVAKSLAARSPDGRTYTFTIRDGFRFSPPSNQPVTAQTFKYSIERSLSPRMKSPFGYQFNDIVGARAYMAGKARHITGVVARGDKLMISLVAPAPDLLTRVAQTVFCAVPDGTPIDPNGLRTIPMAGPYYIASYAPGQGVVLKRNPNYRGGRPHSLAEIAVTVGVAPARAVAQVEAGAADYSPLVSAADAARLTARYGPGSAAAARGGQQYFVDPFDNLWLFDLNARRSLFSDARLRQAVNYAIDRTALYGDGRGFNGAPEPQPTDQYLPPGMPGYHDVTIYPLKPDLGKARQLAHGRRGTAVFYTCNEPTCIRWAQIVRTDLAPIGITVVVRQVALQELSSKILNGAPWDISFVGWQADYPDPHDFLDVLLESGTYVPRFDDPTYRRRLARAAELSGPARYLTYDALAVDLERNAAPWVAFANSSDHSFFSARIGCQIYGDYGMDLAALCIRKRHG